MGKFGVFALIVALCGGLEASWYWPLGSDGVDEKPKRISELIEPASTLIEEASDLAADGKTDEAIEKYRMALDEINRIELENPERAKSVEFATVRNKRAYVNAAIDSMLLSQVQANAKAVAVSDTSELERRMDRERWGKRVDKARESLDRLDPDAALVELEKARAGTTNAAMIAVTHAFGAGAYCLKGSFGEARRAFAQSRQKLAHAGKLADEDRRLVIDCLQGVRQHVVEAHREVLAVGRRACDDSVRLKTMDLTTSNAVTVASGVVSALGALPGYLTMFAVPEARKLNMVSSNLFLRSSILLERMKAGKENPMWNLDVSRLESALDAFDVYSSEMKGVDAGVSAVLKAIGFEEAKEAKETKAAKDEIEDEKPAKPSNALTKREQAMIAIGKGDFKTAERLVAELLAAKPNSAAALNLKAAMEARQGKLKEAEATLDQAIQANPRNHFAYYNMANLMLQVRADDKSFARRYYEAGREFGGPVDARLEEAFK